MGRTKGSKNKAKKTMKVENSAETSTEETNVSPSQNQETKAPEVETTPEVAPESAATDAGAGTSTLVTGDEQKPTPDEQKPALDEHMAPRSKEEQSVEKMNAKIRSLWRDRAMEKQQASEDAKEHSDEIKRIEGEIDKLVQKLEELDIEEIPNHERGIVEYRRKSTGKLVRTRPMVAADRQEKLPFDKSKQAPPDEPAPQKKETFSDLRDGKIWEHDQYGCVRILAVLDDSVRVQTEDLHEPAEGIEIGKADWDANAAFPREVPDLVVGQKWIVKDRRLTLTTLDDRAACYEVEGDSEAAAVGRCSRLSFSSADAKRVDEPAQADVVVPGTIEVGKHYRLMDEGIADGNRLVTVTAVRDGMIDVRWAHSGLGGSVPRAEFAFAEIATQDEIGAAFVAPAKKSRRGKKAEPEAAE